MNRRKKKIIIYYTIEFLLSVTLILSVVLILLQTSLLNEDYMKQQLKKNNYYDEVEKTINEKQKNYIIQSGFPESILDNIVDKDELKRDVDNVLDVLYQKKQLSLHTDNVETRLRENIDAYLEKTGTKVEDESSLDLFAEEVINAYEIGLVSIIPVEKIGKIVFKVNRLVLLLSILSVVFTLGLFFIVKLSLKKVALPIPFITTSIVMLFIGNYIKSHLDINNIFILNQHFSDVFHGVINSILNSINIIAIILIIVGLILNVIFKKTKKVIKNT